jgi:hypothetical protein
VKAGSVASVAAADSSAASVASVHHIVVETDHRADSVSREIVASRVTAQWVANDQHDPHDRARGRVGLVLHDPSRVSVLHGHPVSSSHLVTRLRIQQ